MYQAPVYLLSGLTAEVVSGVIWTPMDVAKSRLQRGAEDPSTGRSAARLLRGVWKKEGWRGIFRVRKSLLLSLQRGSDLAIYLQGYWVSIAVFG